MKQATIVESNLDAQRRMSIVQPIARPAAAVAFEQCPQLTTAIAEIDKFELPPDLAALGIIAQVLPQDAPNRPAGELANGFDTVANGVWWVQH